MTEAAVLVREASSGHHVTRGPVVVLVGLVAGAATGLAARAWMRLVSADPEFTWSGSIFIVGLFGFAGLTQGIACAVRRRGWGWWTQFPFRVVAGFGALLLGGGAGIVMLPAIVAGALSRARTDWSRPARTVAATVAVVDVVAMFWLLGDDLPVWRHVTGWLLMIPLYTVVIGGVAMNLRPLGRVPLGSRRVRLAAGVTAVGLAAAVLVLATVGF